MQVTLLLPLSIEKETPEQTQEKLIKLAREMKDLTQKQLRDRIGLSQKAISNIERGQGTALDSRRRRWGLTKSIT